MIGISAAYFSIDLQHYFFPPVSPLMWREHVPAILLHMHVYVYIEHQVANVPVH